MAKDPAFLFYSSDFLAGVTDLTMEERGQYITLLCLQHQKGHLSDKTTRLAVGSVSVDVLQKFKTDAAGLLYNERLEEEINKRLIFSESRRINGLKGGRKKASAEPNGLPIALPNVLPKNNLPENENINDNELENNEYEEKTPVPFKQPEPPEKLWADPTDPELTMVQEYLLKSPAAGKPAAGMLRGLWDNFKLEFETHFHLSRKDVIIHFCRSLALKDWSKKTAAAEGENVNRANNYLEHLKKNGQ